MKKFFNGFAIAWNMLTNIPLFRIYTFKEGYNAYACVNYGVVGFVLGLIVYLLCKIACIEPYILVKVLIFSFYTFSYGALHLDGLFDSLDAIFLKAPKEKLLSILKDPHLGSFSVIFGTLFIITKLTAFVYLKNMSLFIVAASASRFSVIFPMRFFPYISSGMAQNAKNELKNHHLIIASIIMVVFLSPIYKFSIIILIFSVCCSLFIGNLLTKKFGGLNGDFYGLLIETNELLLILVFVFLGKYLS
jgi:adenosylcobinamide-GDP ribazoletransferase